MVPHILHLHVHTPTIRIVLDTRAQEIWNEIVFHEESQQYALYDQAWERLLNYLQDDIQQELWDDFTVDDASVTVG